MMSRRTVGLALGLLGLLCAVQLLRSAVEHQALNRDLIEAAARGDSTLVQNLLDRGADVNHRNRGLTVLMYAAQFGNRSTVEVLLARGADVHARMGLYWSVLNCAAANRHDRQVLPLLKRVLANK
jgi:ankyrin repeat protein